MTVQVDKSARDVVQRMLKPLCPSTEELLRPINFMKNDRLDITLNKDGTHFEVQAWAECPSYMLSDHISPGQRWTASHNASIGWVKRIPEYSQAKNQAHGAWSIAATDTSALILNAIWEPHRLKFTDQAEIVYQYILTRFLAQTVASQQRALFKIKGQSAAMPDDFEDHPEFPLSKYQQLALLGTLNQEGCALFMEQGTGKTPIVISRIMYEAPKIYEAEKRMYRVLVVAPKNVRSNWKEEVFKFATKTGRVTILRGGQLARMKLLIEAMKPDEDSMYTIIVTSYETVLRSWESIGQIPWDLAVLDESHMIKSERTSRTKKMLELRDKALQRMVLTGTPIANKANDIRTQLEFLGEGLSGFRSSKRFKAFYGKYEKSEDNKHEKFVANRNLPILQERLARISFMITKKEALPHLPKQLFQIKEVSMTTKQRDLYVQLQKHLAIEIEKDMSSGEKTQLTVQNVLVKLLRLAQITSGFIRWSPQKDEDGNIIQEGHFEWINPNPKMDMMIDDICARKPKEKGIVWSCDIPIIQEVGRRLTLKEIDHVFYYGQVKDKDRDENVRRFNQDPGVKILIGNPGAGGVGINLWGHEPSWVGTPQDHGCDCHFVDYFSQDWSMIKRNQSQDRAHRRNTRVPVTYTDYVIAGTVDEEIRTRVMGKTVNALEIQDVRDIMIRVLETLPEID